MEINIDGLDTKKGITMAGGKAEKYLKILSLFCSDGHTKINEIKTCLETENTPLYAVHTHALKSSTAIIGSDKLSNTAKALEQAGKDGDLAFIHANNAAFIADLEILLRNINTFLSKGAEESQKSPIDRELLKNELSRLKTALNDFDFNGINSAVDSLQGFTQAADVGDTVSKILQNKLIGEYDEAILLIDTLLNQNA